MNITHYQELLDIVPPGSSPTQSFLLMQMERIQQLENQLTTMQHQLSNLQATQREIIDVLHRSAQENVRFLNNTEQGIVSVGKSRVAEFLTSSQEIASQIDAIKLNT